MDHVIDHRQDVAVAASDNSRFIARLSDSISHANSLESLVRPLLEMLEAVTGLESTYMTSVDDPARVQHVVYARNTRRLDIPEGLAVPWEDTLCKRALDQGRTYVDDVSNVWGDSDAARALGIETYASAPIHGRNGRLYGTLCAASERRTQSSVDAPRILQMFSQLIAQQMNASACCRS